MENSESDSTSEPGPGELLRRAREAQGISQREMADRLKWIPGYVAAVEENRFEVLRGPAFVRGYLCAYAKLIDVPEELVLAAYAALPPLEQPVDDKLKRVESRVPQVQKKGIALPVGVALVVLLVFLLWYWRGDDQTGTVAPPPTAIELNEVDTPQQAEALVQEQAAVGAIKPEPGVANEVRSDAAEADPISAPAVDTAPTTPAVDTAPTTPAADPGATPVQVNPPASPAAADRAAAEPTAPAGDGPLQFRFSGECWVEVRDAAGELIYADLRRDGDVLNLSGQAPFSILLGDARVVEIDYLERPVVIDRRPGRVTAKLSVGEE